MAVYSTAVPGTAGERIALRVAAARAATGSRRDRLAALTQRPAALLAIVAGLFLIVQVTAVPPSLGLGWDETVYVTQVSGHAPAANFTAPRARGILFLIAPVASQTDSIAVLRVYLAVLSALALFGAYSLWLGVRRTNAVPLAALLFAGLWTTAFYGPAVMPNLWVAFGVVAATALTVRAARDPSRLGLLVGLGAVLAAVGLLRPSEVAWLALALTGALLWRFRHRLRGAIPPLFAVGLGTAAGWTQWIAEAELRYGGLAQRLAASSESNGGGFSVLNFVGDLRAVNGPTGCGVQCPSGVSVLEAGLWAGLLAGTVLGCVVARRVRLRAFVWFPLVVAGAMSAMYLVLIANAAARFLLPAYALLALPCAVAALGLPGLVPPRLRSPVVAVLVVCVAGYLAAQQTVLHAVVSRSQTSQAGITAAAEQLSGLGVQAPCLLTGDWSLQVAYQLGCHAHGIRPPTSSQTPASIQQALDDGMQVVALSRAVPPEGAYVRRWEEQISWTTDRRGQVYMYLPAGEDR